MATGYRYRPLNTQEDEFRLLVFENTTPVRPKDVLRCYLQHESMRRAALLPEFHAVSWTWGDVTDRRSIIVDGWEVMVPGNAEAALRRFVNQLHEDGRKQDARPRRLYFWIDCLCINHADLREKGRHVCLMNGIYSEATTVMIWLGGDEDKVGSSAVQSIQDVVSQCKDETNDLRDLFKRLWDTSARRLSIRSSKDGLPSSCNLQALRAFFSSRWFTRLWVIQEACLAKRTICCYGAHTIPFFDVALAAQWMWFRGRGLLSPNDNPTSKHVIGIRNAAEMFDCLATPHATPKLLWTILAMSMEFETTNPLDKIYGLYGITELWFRQIPRLQLVPDYKARQADLYALATRAAILDSGNLAILAIASRAVNPRPYEVQRVIDMPSWVPRFDWVIDRSKGSTCSIQAPLRGASNGCPVRMSYIQGMPDVLVVQGVIVDRICAVHNLGITHGAQDPETLSSTLTTAWDLASSRADRQLNDSLEQSFIIALCAGQDASYMSIIGDTTFANSGAALFESFQAKSLAQLGKATSAQLHKRKDSAFSYQMDSEQYEKALVNACTGRNFFVTEEGRMGIGPSVMEEGDRVCILPGSTVPLVLREEGVFWRLVGDAYVHGIMDGRYYCELDAFEKLNDRMEWFHIS